MKFKLAIVFIWTALLAGCANYALLDKDAPEFSETYSFKRPMAPVILSYNGSKEPSSILKEIYTAFQLAEDKNGYAETNDEYYGSGSRLKTNGSIIELDFYNRISNSTTHALSRFRVEVLPSSVGYKLSISPENSILKKEGFHMFGKVDTLLEYDRLESYITSIYESVQWPFEVVEG